MPDIHKSLTVSLPYRAGAQTACWLSRPAAECTCSAIWYITTHSVTGECFQFSPITKCAVQGLRLRVQCSWFSSYSCVCIQGDHLPHGGSAMQGWYKSCMVIVTPCRSDLSAAGLSPLSHLSDGRLTLALVRQCSILDYLRFLALIPRKGAAIYVSVSCNMISGN